MKIGIVAGNPSNKVHDESNIKHFKMVWIKDVSPINCAHVLRIYHVTEKGEYITDDTGHRSCWEQTMEHTRNGPCPNMAHSLSLIAEFMERNPESGPVR